MPFQSEKQRRYLHANHPEIAKRWEKEYSNGGILDIDGSEEITTEEGNDISLVDESEIGVSTLFKAKDGGTPQLAKKSKDGTRPGYRGSDWGGGNPNEDRAKEEAGLTGLQGFMQDLQTGILSGIPGITNPQSNIDREKAEAEASQPGDMDFELEINEDNIKQDKVNDVVADLITKNVYIEGVGYVPLAGLMSPKDSLPV